MPDAVKTGVLILLTIALLVPGALVTAQDAPVVYAVLFFSPNCGHCHHLIEETLPPIQDEFGEQLVVLFVDVTTQGGSLLAATAYQQHNIPQDDWGVPMMVVDDTILIGSADIPDQLPGITRDGLARGGVALPDLPGLAEAYAEIAGQASSSASAPASSTWLDRYEADPANRFAVIVLVGLALSLMVALIASGRRLSDALMRWVVTVITLGGLIVALSLAIAAGDDWLALGMSVGASVALASAISATRQHLMMGALALAGLLAAIYLSYVELTHDSASCGLMGDCNAVQQSDYAQLFGLLPVGVAGLAGYGLILALWGLSRGGHRPALDAALLVITLGGTAFSAYLTFLEPFVIGATCMWCLLSALTMMALLWLSLSAGWPAVRTISGNHHDRTGPLRPSDHAVT